MYSYWQSKQEINMQKAELKLECAEANRKMQAWGLFSLALAKPTGKQKNNDANEEEIDKSLKHDLSPQQEFVTRKRRMGDRGNKVQQGTRSHKQWLAQAETNRVLQLTDREHEQAGGLYSVPH